MTRRTAFFFSCLAAVAFASCSGPSSSYSNQGQRLEAEGHHQEAAHFYMQSLRGDMNNVDARLGLRGAGQKVLDQKLGEFWRSHSVEQHKQALASYQDAKAYYDEVNYYNIQLNFPSHYEGFYQESKKAYLDELYEEAQGYLDAGDYDSAEEIFIEMAAIDPKYKDVKTLKRVANLEPLYQQGLEAMSLDHWRQAYKAFDEIYQTDKGYKDVAQKRNECKEEAILSVGVLPFINETSTTGIERDVSGFVISELAGARGSMLQLVDREHIDKVIEEQKLGLSGLVDEASAARAGELIGVKSVLISEVTSYNEQPLRTNTQNKTAYIPRQVRQSNPYTGQTFFQTVYDPVSYQETTSSARAEVTLKYRLISSETGEILTTGTVNMVETEEVRFSKYDGDYRQLSPTANPASGSSFSRTTREFQELFTTNRTTRSLEQVRSALFNKLAHKVSEDILSYDASRE